MHDDAAPLRVRLEPSVELARCGLLGKARHEAVVEAAHELGLVLRERVERAVLELEAIKRAVRLVAEVREDPRGAFEGVARSGCLATVRATCGREGSFEAVAHGLSRALRARDPCREEPPDELVAARGERDGLRVDGGVVVDEYLRSSDAHVLAAGDVALARCTALGTALRVEHWDNAIRQGELAARTILGTGQTYDWLPFFFTDQFELGMEYVGSSGPDDDVVVRGDMAAGEFITFWLAQGRVTAAMHVQQWGTIDTLRGIVGRVVPPGRLTDTRIDLEEI